MFIVLMGVAGSGKTTLGRQLSEELRWLFLDGDDVHPLENIIKMGRLTARTGHCAGVALLESQMALLEEPSHALTLDASQTPDRLVQTIRNTWKL
jgi:gluconate kinase